MKRMSFLGCPIDDLSIKEVITFLEEFIRSGEPHQIVPINAAKLWRMERDKRLNQVVKQAHLVIPEKAIVIGSRILGNPLKAHVGGIMLVKALLPVAAKKGYRVYFLGTRQDVVNKMVSNLQRNHPTLKIVGWHHGYIRQNDTSRIAKKIKNAKPDILLVAMGTPKQEYWINDHFHEIGVPVCIGVGGSFDILAGIKKDTPPFVRRLGMEWLYRMMQDPYNLWKRYLITIPWFLYKVAVVKIHSIFQSRSGYNRLGDRL
ncbi:MAG: WecB/TagA/CpsF family glycosyltransferase [Candidatus Marinimicrobia bacterium]|nr:WecB/TagA/CpsF family glycosyltransferase [candidate division WOR-3 bacterium]MCK4445832.1 WecB/TagA/CpsF family glycosyltransferase [Candidatus Neomarinimicrobiota bacterium]